MVPDFLTLLDNLSPIFERGDESLRKALAIVESYVVLDAPQFLQAYSAQFVHVIINLLTEVKSDGIGLIIKVGIDCVGQCNRYDSLGCSCLFIKLIMISIIVSRPRHHLISRLIRDYCVILTGLPRLWMSFASAFRKRGLSSLKRFCNACLLWRSIKR